MKKKIIFLALAYLLSAHIADAQKPEIIDVQSYEINRRVHWTTAKFIMKARNSNGQIVEYIGTGNYVVSPLLSCNPCNLPNTFSSNGFFSLPFGFRFIAGFDTPVDFHVTDVSAEPIILHPTILRKRQLIVRKGAVTVKGRIEVWSSGMLLAVDNSIDLSGSYSAEFVPVNNADGRKVAFSIISYTLNQNL